MGKKTLSGDYEGIMVVDKWLLRPDSCIGGADSHQT